MAKQTFTTGQVLTAAQVNALQANDFNQTVSVKTANYVLAATDKGTRVEFNTSGSVTCTVNSGLFDAGDTLVIQNRGAGTATITAGTATVNTSASLALAQYSAGTLYFLSDSAALFFGDAAGISASIVDAKADLIVGTADNTVGRLAVGANATVLTADSTVSPTGLKWAAPASWTLDSTTTLSGASTSINLTAGYQAFHIYCINYQFTNDAYGYIRFNSNTGSVYRWYGLSLTGTTANASFYANSDTAYFLSNAQPAESGSQNNTFYMQLYNMGSTTAHKQFLISDKSLSSGAEKRIANAGGFFESTTAITTIQIFTNDTWSGGTVLVYGVK